MVSENSQSRNEISLEVNDASQIVVALAGIEDPDGLQASTTTSTAGNHTSKQPTAASATSAATTSHTSAALVYVCRGPRRLVWSRDRPSILDGSLEISLATLPGRVV